MAPKRTLVVDDSLSTRMMTKAMLANSSPDWSVVDAKDGADALEKCEGTTFHFTLQGAELEKAAND